MRPRRPPRPAEPIERIGYRPAPPYTLDVEVFSWRSLAARVPARDLSTAHRIEYHELILVTRGHCNHVIDFDPIRSEPGSVLVSYPGQTEQFDVSRAWDGWLVLFRPEFLFDPVERKAVRTTSDLSLVGVLAGLPRHLALTEAEFRLVGDLLARMHADSQQMLPVAEAHALLRHQLCTLLLRLGRAHRRQHEDQSLPAPSEMRNFRRLQGLVERSFKSWHQVGPYANALGCTEKTLTRAAVGVAGITAKALITARIALEAKRLLVHTSVSVASIADELGFDDPSNFVKFFRREAGCAPLEFRRRHLAA